MAFHSLYSDERSWSHCEFSLTNSTFLLKDWENVYFWSWESSGGRGRGGRGEISKIRKRDLKKIERRNSGVGGGGRGGEGLVSDNKGDAVHLIRGATFCWFQARPRMEVVSEPQHISSRWYSWTPLCRTQLSRTPRYLEQNRSSLWFTLVFSIIFYGLSWTPRDLNSPAISKFITFRRNTGQHQSGCAVTAPPDKMYWKLRNQYWRVHGNESNIQADWTQKVTSCRYCVKHSRRLPIKLTTVNSL